MQMEIREYKYKLYCQRREKFIESTFKKLRNSMASICNTKKCFHAQNQQSNVLTAIRNNKVQYQIQQSSQSTAASTTKPRDAIKQINKIIRIVQSAYQGIKQFSQFAQQSYMQSIYYEIKQAVDKLINHIDVNDANLIDKLVHQVKRLTIKQDQQQPSEDLDINEIDVLINENKNVDVSVNQANYCIFICVIISIRPILCLCSRATLIQIESDMLGCLYLDKVQLNLLCYDILTNLYQSSSWLLQQSRCTQPILNLIDYILFSIETEQLGVDKTEFCQFTMVFELLTCIIEKIDPWRLALILNHTQLLYTLITIKAAGLINLCLHMLLPQDKVNISKVLEQNYGYNLQDLI